MATPRISPSLARVPRPLSARVYLARNLWRALPMAGVIALAARAVVHHPDLVFADEPTAALDRTTGHQVIEQLAAHRNRGALVVVTHDAEMLAAADRVWALRDGRLQE